MTTPATSSSSSKAKPNGAAAPAAAPPPEWLTWPSERQAAKSLGTSNTQLRSIVAKLGLQPVKGFDGSNRYSPELLGQVERVLLVAQEVADDEDSPAAVPTETTVIRELVGIVREQRTHIQALMGLVTGPMTKMLDSYDQHQTRSEARIKVLEEARDVANKERAEYLDDQEARELFKRGEADKLERRRELFSVVKGKLPSIIDAIEQSLGGGMTTEKLTAAAALLKSLDPAQLAVLVDPSMTILNEKQRALVRKVLGLADEAATPTEEKKPPSETPTEKDK